jgi:hypothetical protein
LSDAARPPILAQLLALPDPERDLLLWMQRQTVCSLAAVQGFLQQSEATTLGLLQGLEQRGYLECLPGAEDGPTYRVSIISMRQRRRQTQTAPSPLEAWPQSLD